ncbi:MAG: protein kinase domain-containing protein [Anaerolineae bacterium]
MTTTKSTPTTIIRDLMARLRHFARAEEKNPHKHVMLLAIGAVLELDPSHPNRFTFQEIEPVFLEQFQSHFPSWPTARRHLEYPFYHLQHDGCWHLQVKAGMQMLFEHYKQTRLTRTRLMETVSFGYLDEAIYDALGTAEGRTCLEQSVLLWFFGDKDASAASGIAEVGTVYETTASDTSLFAHERKGIEAITKGLGGNGRMLPNVMLYDDQNNAYHECDAIVVSPAGLFVVELKHWSGHIRIAPNYWEINGFQHRRDPHLTNVVKCKHLKHRLERKLPFLPALWVESVVVLTNDSAEVENADIPAAAAKADRRNLTFASVDDFLSFLHKRVHLRAPALKNEHLTAIVAALRADALPPQPRRYSIPGYETVTYLAQTAERIELLARPTDGRTRGLFRFRVFRLPPGASAQERKRAETRALNTRDALARIGEHPHVQPVWITYSEDGDIIEGSPWSEAGTLRETLARPPLPLDEALRIARQAALGLQAVHKAGIVHRAIKPEHILMVNDIPKLTDLDLSFHLDRAPGHVTVLPDPSHLEDDGYTAPELLEGRDFDESSDVFSLGAIVYHLLTGQKAFATARQLVAQGGRLGPGEQQRLAELGVPPEVVAAIERATRADRRERLADVGELAAALAKPGEPPAPLNAVLAPGAEYDLYRIEKLLGQGAQAQVYCAERLGERVALKLFHREVPREVIAQQRCLALAVRSPYVVGSDGHLGVWNKDRFFLVMEYVEGETLRAVVEAGRRPSMEQFGRVALDLLEALAAFHEHCDENGQQAPLVHGDIKPDNIVLTPDGLPKVMDFSVAGPPRLDPFAGTVGYVPPDRILGEEMEFAPDGDLFALGVTLWEWLWGCKPYAQPSIGAQPAFPAGVEEVVSPALRAWLEKAVATQAQHRFGSAREMRAALEAALGMVTPPRPALPDEEDALEEQQPVEPPAAPVPSVVPVAVSSAGNPFAAYLNTLANASGGNENALAEAHVRSPHFARVHVSNPLAEVVAQQLLHQRRNVILTGNAGDGKTTIAAEIYDKLTGAPLPAQPRVRVAEQQITIVKDMSEMEPAQRAHVLQEAAQQQGDVFLIVTNTGTLLESAIRLPAAMGRPGVVRSELLKALEADEAVPVLDGRFLLLNVGRIDSIATACAVLRRMVAAENWEACATCPHAALCPIWTNVQLVGEHVERVLLRVEWAYRRLYEYGVRLTLRQMTGHLAYSLTGGRDCGDVAGLSLTALSAAVLAGLFSNRFFGDDGHALQPEATQIQPVLALRAAELGVALDPAFERLAWGDELALPDLCQRGQELWATLRRRGRTDAASRVQGRRFAYFWAPLDQAQDRGFLAAFLRSPLLLQYLSISRGTGAMEPAWEQTWRRRVLQVLQEHYLGLRLPEGRWDDKDRLYLTLSRRTSGSHTQVVLASQSGDDFRLRLQEAHRSIPNSGRRLLLVHAKGARLALDLPFLDYVARRFEGELSAQVSAFYSDRLERYQAQLLRTCAAEEVPDTLRLLRVGADRRLQALRLRLGDQLEVLR